MAVHDSDLLAQLDELPLLCDEIEVYRAVFPGDRDPLAVSNRGGRWAPAGVSVLYTSTEQDGAVAEVASWLSILVPKPRDTQLTVHRLQVSFDQAARLDPPLLARLDIDLDNYTLREYEKTSEVGACLAHLGYDAVFVRSARWDCDNLVLFDQNRGIDSAALTGHSTVVDWVDWLAKNQPMTGR